MKRSSRRWPVVAGILVLLVGCGPTDAGTPAAAVAGPASAASSPPSAPVPSPGASSSSRPTSPAQTRAAGPAAPTETMVWIPAGDHRVPGTLALLARTPEQVPAVLLLHGDLSSRDENGNMFGRLAAALAARGIASLRIDFAGSGDSEEPDLALDYPGMVLDATAALGYLRQDAALDPDRIAVLGLSRGGSIAATVAGTVPGVAALVSWSGAIANGYEEDPAAHEEARENGEVVVDLGDRDFQLSLAWFDTILDSHPLDDIADFTNPVLAVVGSDDDIVPPEISETFLATVASADKSLHVVDGADHGFTAEQVYGDEAIAVTTDWLTATLLR